MFMDMLLERQAANNFTFTALINAYGRSGRVAEALEVFEHMKAAEEAETQ